MKQILQNLRTGETELADVPCPAVPAGHLLIRSTHTLISAGTERMLVEFGKANLVDKARQQPDKVRQALDKVRTDGLLPTVEAIRNKLDQPLALGYCNVGRVLEVGRGASGFEVGDRVASNGKHAEVVAVPTHLCAKVPDGVSDEAAAFTVLGAIALQGIRLVAPTLGETIAVTGLGLIGLATVQMLRANGCRVIGLDPDPARLSLAKAMGAETIDLSAGADPVKIAAALTQGHGVDGVLITASTTSSEPVRQAAHMCRKRGRIVLVGVTGLELSRADFFEKELTFQISCSYGPGRYEPAYEQKGLDYPIGFVRWTEQRNLEAVLGLLADGRFDVGPLVSHRFDIADAARAYAVVGGAEPSLGIIVRYPTVEEKADAVVREPTVALAPATPVISGGKSGKVGIGVIGSGNYASAVLIPAMKAAGAHLRNVASSAGVSGVHAGKKFGFERATTDVDGLLADAMIDAVVIATQHNTHADLVVRALEAGKHVFVEKPLALTLEEVDAVEAAMTRATAAGRPRHVMVGFNRRFAPHVVKMKELLKGGGPSAFVMTVNAGAIPAAHWTQDPGVGGGRIIGEACHFIDLLRHLADAPISSHHVSFMASPTADTATLSLAFANGSIGAVHYFANGSKQVSKERLEAFDQGRVLQLDNFRRLTGHGVKGFKSLGGWRQDKGQAACATAFIDAIAKGGPPPIPPEEIIEVARVSIALAAEGATR